VINCGHVTTTHYQAINAARKWFADNALACAMAAHSRSDSVVLQNGEFYVNDLDNYRDGQQRLASEYLAGMYDHTFTILQMAYQTGACVALLPSYSPSAVKKTTT
jgi:hypothetical protein